MARCSARLPDLVEMCHERQDALIFPALIDERFAAAERSAGAAEEIENGGLRVADVDLAIRLLLGPSCTCDKEKFCVRSDGLSVLHGRALPADACAQPG